MILFIVPFILPFILNLKYILKGIDTWKYKNNWIIETNIFEIYPKRNWYTCPKCHYKVNVRFEIYPKRNWYRGTGTGTGGYHGIDLKYILKGIDTKKDGKTYVEPDAFEIYPKRNWYYVGFAWARQLYTHLKYILKGIDTIQHPQREVKPQQIWNIS